MKTAKVNSRLAAIFFLTLFVLILFSALPASAAGTATVTEVHDYPDAVETRTPRGFMLGTINLLDLQHPVYNGVEYELESIAVEKTALPALYYTVNFVANGGAPAPPAQTVAHGEKVTKPYDPDRAGYTFAGWYQAADFSGSAWDFDNDTVTGDMTLYANWTAKVNYVVVFVANGGIPVPPFQTVPSGQKATNPVDPSRDNYVFGGWYTAWDFSSPAWDFDNDTITGNTILYAQWILETVASPVSLNQAPSPFDAATVWTAGQPNNNADFTFEEGYEYRITYHYKAVQRPTAPIGTPNPDSSYTPIGDQPVPADQLPDLVTIPDNEVPLVGSPQTGAPRSRGAGVAGALLLMLYGFAAGCPARKNGK